MKYCSACGVPLAREVPDGDNRERAVCRDGCGRIHYKNPRVVVGAVVTWGDRYLLCRRAIEPRTGFWTLPAGFMETDETTADGARRETHEEATADIELTGLLAVYDLVHIQQVQLFYAATMRTPHYAAGIESLDVGLFAWEEIPWPSLAFQTVHWALHYHRAVAGQAVFPPEVRTSETRV